MSHGNLFLSVIVPVFNEERTISELLRRLLSGPYTAPEMEVVLVDDGSFDGTAQILDSFRDCPGVTVIHHDRNRGKGAAIRTGLTQARGEVTVIQDADLEYDPRDLPRLVEVIRRGEAEVVFGSRYLEGPPLPWTRFRAAVVVLNWFVRLLYGQRLTDEATCYKAFRTKLLRQMDLRAKRFEFCPEVTAKACRLGHRILEVPISYAPRGVADGKKINWRDGVQAFWTLLVWRFRRIGPRKRLGTAVERPEIALVRE